MTVRLLVVRECLRSQVTLRVRPPEVYVTASPAERGQFSLYGSGVDSARLSVCLARSLLTDSRRSVLDSA